MKRFKNWFLGDDTSEEGEGEGHPNGTEALNEADHTAAASGGFGAQTFASPRDDVYDVPPALPPRRGKRGGEQRPQPIGRRTSWIRRGRPEALVPVPPGQVIEDITPECFAIDVLSAKHPVELDFSGQGYRLRSLEGLRSLRDGALARLDVSDCVLEQLAGIEGFFALEKLIANGNKLRHVMLAFPRLRILELRNNELDAIPDLRGVGSLVELDLSFNKMDGTLQGVAFCPRLRVFRVAGNSFSWDRYKLVDNLTHIHALKKLSQLDFSDNPFVDSIEDYRLWVLSNMPGSLDLLDGCPITKDDRNRAKEGMKRGYSIAPMLQQQIKREIFGYDLSFVLQNEKSHIPLIVEETVRCLERQGMTTPHLFAKPIDDDSVRKLQIEYEQDTEEGAEVLLKCDMPDVVAALLRKFFAQLTQPIMTLDGYDQFVKLVEVKAEEDEDEDSEDEEERRMALTAEVAKLPPHNKLAFERVLHMLGRYLSHAKENGTSAEELGAIWGPVFLRAPPPRVTDTTRVAEVITKLLQAYAVWNDSEEEDATSRHSQPIVPDKKTVRNVETVSIVPPVRTLSNKRSEDDSEVYSLDRDPSSSSAAEDSLFTLPLDELPSRGNSEKRHHRSRSVGEKDDIFGRESYPSGSQTERATASTPAPTGQQPPRGGGAIGQDTVARFGLSLHALEQATGVPSVLWTTYLKTHGREPGRAKQTVVGGGELDYLRGEVEKRDVALKEMRELLRVGEAKVKALERSVLEIEKNNHAAREIVRYTFDDASRTVVRELTEKLCEKDDLMKAQSSELARWRGLALRHDLPEESSAVVEKLIEDVRDRDVIIEQRRREISRLKGEGRTDVADLHIELEQYRARLREREEEVELSYRDLEKWRAAYDDVVAQNDMLLKELERADNSLKTYQKRDGNQGVGDDERRYKLEQLEGTLNRKTNEAAHWKSEASKVMNELVALREGQGPMTSRMETEDTEMIRRELGEKAYELQQAKVELRNLREQLNAARTGIGDEADEMRRRLHEKDEEVFEMRTQLDQQIQRAEHLEEELRYYSRG